MALDWAQQCACCLGQHCVGGGGAGTSIMQCSVGTGTCKSDSDPVAS